MTTAAQADISTAPAVLELASIQAELGLPDGDFARSVKFAYSGSSWGKIKSGTFSGNNDKALKAVKAALNNHRIGGEVELLHGAVVFPHTTAALDAVEVARVATDEHKLVIVSGPSGGGKSVTARTLSTEFGGHYLHARPSWQTSYFRSLMDLASALGVGTGDIRSAAQAEGAILTALTSSPALLIIDEANHFSRDLINFLKTILNETACTIVLFTLPAHLARLAAVHAEESRQLLRRAVAIIHIPAVSSREVMAIHSGLYPEIHLGTVAPAIASAANRLARLDTVCRIFEEAEPTDPDDLRSAIERVEKSLRAVLPASA